MVASAVFILDLKGKTIICRNYRGDVPMTAAERFVSHVLESDESDLRPVIVDDGFTFVYIKHNNLYCELSPENGFACFTGRRFIKHFFLHIRFCFAL
jgi:hypothetical protein